MAKSKKKNPDDPVTYGYKPKTEIGRLLMEARLAFYQEHGDFLTRDQVNELVAARRGGLAEPTTKKRKKKRRAS